MKALKGIVLDMHFDRMWLEAVTIAGHAAFCSESIACAYPELRPFKDGWVSLSQN